MSLSISRQMEKTNDDSVGWNEATTSSEVSQIGSDDDRIQKLVELVLKHVKAVHHGDFDSTKADAVAGVALEAQLELAGPLSEAEFRAKHAKHEVEYIESETAYKVRSASDKKISEANLEQLVNKDPEVRKAKLNFANAEKEFKKWQYIFGTLKDAHIFFRTLDKKV